MPETKIVRKSIADKRARRNPIPAGCAIGNLILPSVIRGYDPDKMELPSDPATQIAQAFENMKTVVEAGGGTVDNIGKITVYLTDFSHREFVNDCWVKFFPDPDSRPARHVMKIDVQGGACIELDVIAVV